jgi:hypothetical protein
MGEEHIELSEARVSPSGERIGERLRQERARENVAHRQSAVANRLVGTVPRRKHSDLVTALRECAGALGGEPRRTALHVGEPLISRDEHAHAQASSLSETS